VGRRRLGEHPPLLDAECAGDGDERPKRQDSDGERQPVTPEGWAVGSHGGPELKPDGVPVEGVEEVEFATLEWVAWYNTRRLLEPLGYVPRTSSSRPTTVTSRLQPSW